MNNKTDPDKLFSQGDEVNKRLFEFYKTHPVQACQDLLCQDLDVFQRVVLNGVLSHSKTASVLGRGCGKTRLISYTSALACMFTPGLRVGMLGPIFRCPEASTTYCFTDKGMLKASELDIKPNIFSLKKENKITEFNLNEEEEGTEIWTERGFYIAGKNDHKVLILNTDNFNFEYKNIQDLTYKDNILIKNNIDYWNKNEVSFLKTIRSFNPKNISFNKVYNKLDINKVDVDTFYLFGQITGDGCIEANKERINLATADKETIDFFRNELEKILVPIRDDKLHIGKQKDYVNYSIQNKELFEFFKFIGFKPNCGAVKKDIPYLVRTAPKKYISAFLQGLFDSDGTISLPYKNNCIQVKLTTSSFDLAHQVQTLLLNYGIVSAVQRNKGRGEIEIKGIKTTSRDFFDVLIQNKNSVVKFGEEIGFRLKRKQDRLLEYMKIDFSDKNGSMQFENLGKVIKQVIKDHKIKNHKINRLSDDCAMNIAMRYVEELENDRCIKDERLSNIRRVFELNLFSVKLKEKNKKKVVTVAAQVENEHCYNGSGFINHNTAKLAYAELEAVILESPYLQASIKRTSKQSDTWLVEFHNGAFIFALPLAADSKNSIRGVRLHKANLDEAPHIPLEIIDAVITPMLATQNSPMKNVRRIQAEQKLLAEGKITKEELTKQVQNSVHLWSSAYFQFNHYYKTVCDYRELGAKQKAETGKSDYAVYVFNYLDASPGFFDMTLIEHAKATIAPITFDMEYLSIFPPDSHGFFKRSLLDTCVLQGHKVRLEGENGKRYVMGIDPARANDAFGIQILEFCPPAEMRLVRTIAYQSVPFPIVAERIRKLCKEYDILMIGMDAGGGGLAMKDLLANPLSADAPEDVILDLEDELNIGKKGTHILKMINFSSDWISEANFDMQSSFEHKKLLLPDHAPSNTYIKPVEDEDDFKDTAIVEFLKTIEELTSIVVTATKTGVLHFDTPKAGMRKDRYSALLVAHKILYDYIKSGYQKRELASGGFMGQTTGEFIAEENQEQWHETSAIETYRKRDTKEKFDVGDGALTKD